MQNVCYEARAVSDNGYAFAFVDDLTDELNLKN